MAVAQTITHAINELPVVDGDIVVTPDSRFWTLENKLIRGNVIIGRGCSHYTLRHLRIEGGSLRVEGLNFHGLFQNVWIQGAPIHGIYAGGYGNQDICNALTFQNVFASHCGAWGWLMVQHTGLTLQGCSADQNAAGGFLFNGCAGTFGITAESNQGTGAHFYDSKGAILEPFIDSLPNRTDLIINGGSIISRIGA